MATRLTPWCTLNSAPDRFKHFVALELHFECLTMKIQTVATGLHTIWTMILDFKRRLEEGLESMEESSIDDVTEEKRKEIETKLQSQYSMKEDKLEAHMRDWRKPINKTKKTLTRSDITWSYTRTIINLFDRWYGMTDTAAIDRMQEAANNVQCEAFQRLIQNEDLGNGISKAQRQAVADELSRLYLQMTSFADLEEAIQNALSCTVRVPMLMLCFTRASKELSAYSTTAIRSLVGDIRTELSLEVTNQFIEHLKKSPLADRPIKYTSAIRIAELKVALADKELADERARTKSKNILINGTDDDKNDQQLEMSNSKIDGAKDSCKPAPRRPRRTQWLQQDAPTKFSAMQHRRDVKIARQASSPGYSFRHLLESF